jgi:hypothetical protein
VKAENATISVRTTVRNEYDITKPVTSMIRTCQGKTELPLHSKERPESR